MIEENKQKIKSFTDLNAWKEGHCLVLLIYKLISSFPQEEKFALADQMRRCVTSVTSNIAEGFSRQSKKEKLQFYSISKGSLTELQNQLIIARDVRYISEVTFGETIEKITAVGRLLTGLIQYLR
ncbi:MAG: four helix bundle protein [Candidatus Staskawiczbacteria bacterium]|nr:four helix bundle protein [Candidatus Staskawiczbacteria bacterium]